MKHMIFWHNLWHKYKMCDTKNNVSIQILQIACAKGEGSNGLAGRVSFNEGLGEGPNVNVSSRTATVGG